MASNRLAGAGPSAPTPGAGDGPSPGLAGTLGVAPQAPPQTTSNMLSGASQAQPQGSPQPMMPRPAAPPIVPPSREMLSEAFHKQSYAASALRGLLGKPNLTDRDVIDAVGEVVADGVMSSFRAANYLKDLPTDAEPLQLRQWVGQHYAASAKALQTVSEMIAAEGAMARRRGTPRAQVMPSQPQPASAPQNMLSASPAPSQIPGAANG